MTDYSASCHCGKVSFHFQTPSIKEGLYCNCSLCKRKGTMMSRFTLSEKAMGSVVTNEALSCYQFGSDKAKHYFCKYCGIYPFHQSMRDKEGMKQYRVNLGCIDGLDVHALESSVFDGANLL